MVQHKVLTRTASNWTVIACLLLCSSLVQAGAVSKSVNKKPILSKEPHKKPNSDLTKATTTDSFIKLADNNLNKNESIAVYQKLLDCTTKAGVTLATEADTLQLKKDITSSTTHAFEDATTPFYSTAPSIDGQSLPATTVQSTGTPTTDTIRDAVASAETIPCTCGIFLSSQLQKGSQQTPKGEAVISNTLSRTYSCDGVGQKHCQTKCLEQIVQHLPNSAKILCASLDRDIRKEKAYLFIKNCGNKWINTNLTAGREYCCKNRQAYNCK